MTSSRLYPSRLFLIVLLLGFPSLAGAPVPTGAEALQEAQAAFRARQYERALELLESLEKDGKDAAAVRRLRVRTLAKLGKPLDALTEYEALRRPTGKDDAPLLREVAFGFILPLLKDMRVQMRGAGYTALKETESDEAVPYLEEGLADGAGQVRALAAEALGQLDAGRRSPRLKRALQDQAAYVRKYAVWALGQTGDRSLVGLIEKSLEDEEPIVRVSAAAALAKLNQPAGWDRLNRSVKSGNPDERSTALLMLGALKRGAAYPEFEAAASDRQPSIRAAALSGLGDLGDRKAGPILLKALRDPVPSVRGAALIGLAKLRDTEATGEIKRLLHDKNPGVRADAAAVLLEFGEPYATVAGTVQELIEDKEPSVRARVAKSLAKGRGKSVTDTVEALRLLLQDTLPVPRMAAARALGHARITGDRALTLLKEALRDQDEAVRATAAGALIRWLDGKAGTARSFLAE